MSSLLLACQDKDSALLHYVPALLGAGWPGTVRRVAPGEDPGDLSAVAGLVLAGGADMHPSCWDPPEAVHPEAKPSPERDALEVPLVRQAWALGLPILGICRGEQVLNVALGGSLHQHVPEAFDCPVERHRHGSSEAGPELWHDVDVVPGSRLAQALGAERVPVNSRHHQAVARLAPGLKAVAWHPETDGAHGPLVEGIEAEDPGRWVVGVQWHPENLVGLPGPGGEAARGLFAAYLAAVRDRAGQRTGR